MKNYLLSKAALLVASAFVLHATAAFAQTITPHPLLLDGNISSYININSGWSNSSNQPTGGIYDSNTYGSWSSTSGTTFTHYPPAVLPGLRVNTLDAFSLQHLSEANDSWNVLIRTGGFNDMSATISITGSSTWQTIDFYEITFAVAYGPTGTWDVLRTMGGIQTLPIEHIAITTSSGVSIANFSMTSGSDTELLLFTVPNTPAVPEPGSVAMLLGGAGALLLMGRRRFSRNRA